MAVSAALALTVSLAACASGGATGPAQITADPKPGETTGDVTVMRNPSEITDEMIAEFEALYPDVTVTAIDDDSVKLKALQAAGDAPDIFRTDGPSIPTLVAQGQVMDLTEPLESAGITEDDAFDVVDLYVVDGKRYGVPKDWSPDFTVFVNNELFDNAGIAVPDPSSPISFEELADLAAKLTVTDGTSTSQFGLGGAWDTFSPARVISAALAESGEELYSSDQKAMDLTSNPKAMEALAYMADLAKSGVTHSPLNPSAEWSGADFLAGTTAMVIYGYWFNGLLTSGDSAVGDSYTVLPAPYWSDESSRVNPTITGTGYVMSSQSENADAAWAFLRFVSTGEQAEARAQAGYGLPVVTSQMSLLPQDTPAQVQAYDVVLKEAENSPALQFNRYYNDGVFTDSYNKYLQDYIKGSISLEELAAGIETDVNAAIADGVSQAP